MSLKKYKEEVFLSLFDILSKTPYSIKKKGKILEMADIILKKSNKKTILIITILGLSTVIKDIKE